MPQQVVAGAMMMCTFGVSPSALNVLPIKKVLVDGPPAANILDQKPFENIPPFGLCMSLANPAVASATAAAMGVLTPMPCSPVVPAPWMPGSPTVLIDSMPALNNTCICNCIYGGVISIAFPGQVTTNVA